MRGQRHARPALITLFQRQALFGHAQRLLSLAQRPEDLSPDLQQPRAPAWAAQATHISFPLIEHREQLLRRHLREKPRGVGPIEIRTGDLPAHVGSLQLGPARRVKGEAQDPAVPRQRHVLVAEHVQPVGLFGGRLDLQPQIAELHGRLQGLLGQAQGLGVPALLMELGRLPQQQLHRPPADLLHAPRASGGSLPERAPPGNTAARDQDLEPRSGDRRSVHVHVHVHVHDHVSVSVSVDVGSAGVGLGGRRRD